MACLVAVGLLGLLGAAVAEPATADGELPFRASHGRQSLSFPYSMRLFLTTKWRDRVARQGRRRW